MGSHYRLSAVVCHEMSEAKYAQRELDRAIDEGLVDGRLTTEEIARIRRAQTEANRELDEALVVAEETDNVEAHYDFARKRTLKAQPHQYLREKSASVGRMRIEFVSKYPPEEPKPTPSAALRFTVRRKGKAPLAGERRTGRDNKSLG